MHFWKVIEGGNTEFSPMNEVVLGLPPHIRAEFEKLYFLSGNSGRGTIVHPLIYPHPVTGKDTLCMHCGECFVRTFARNVNTSDGTAESVYDWEDTVGVLRTIGKSLDSRKYSHEWREGDFAILDNRAIAHFASKGT